VLGNINIKLVSKLLLPLKNIWVVQLRAGKEEVIGVNEQLFVINDSTVFFPLGIQDISQIGIITVI
jgi:hypothetical protein